MSTQDRDYIVSFHPLIRGDRFFWERAALGPEVICAIRKAKAVILPQTVSRELYFLCRSLCPRVFPNYDIRFKWEGKLGDTMLFWTFGVPHPRTIIFPRVETLVGNHPQMGSRPKLPDFPFVIKGAHGGEGQQTWLIEDKDDLSQALQLLERLEWQGIFGFVIQKFIPGLERDLRVTVIGNQIHSYWRINPSGFHKNIAQGGEIDHDSDPWLQKLGRQMVRQLCQQTGINLAGFDLVFPDANEPMFLEVNYTFGRSGLGGSDGFYRILQKEVDAWLKRINTVG